MAWNFSDNIKYVNKMLNIRRPNVKYALFTPIFSQRKKIGYNPLGPVVILYRNSKPTIIMDSKKYYERHLRWGYIYYPYAGRLMDYLLARAETYPRCIDGVDVPPGCVFTSRAELCDEIAIADHEIPHAINELNFKDLIRTTSYSATTICLTVVLDPDEITTPPEAPEISSTNEPACPSVGAQSTAPAQPELTKWSVALYRPIESPSKPRRGALVFSPVWSAAQHGVPIQANRNEPQRGGIVLPSKTAPFPQPAHSKWSVALDRPTRLANRPSVELQRHPPTLHKLPPNPTSLLYGSGQRPRQKPHSGDNFVGTGVSPCKSAIKRTSRVSGDIFDRVGVSPLAPPIESPSKPRRGALMFSPCGAQRIHPSAALPNSTAPRPERAKIFQAHIDLFFTPALRSPPL